MIALVTIAITVGVLSLASSGGILLYLRAILKRFDFGAMALQMAADQVRELKAENASLRAEVAFSRGAPQPSTLEAAPAEDGAPG